MNGCWIFLAIFFQVLDYSTGRPVESYPALTAADGIGGGGGGGGGVGPEEGGGGGGSASAPQWGGTEYCSYLTCAQFIGEFLKNKISIEK